LLERLFSHKAGKHFENSLFFFFEFLLDFRSPVSARV